MSNSKLQGNNDAMNWCQGKTPAQIYVKYLRFLAIQVEQADKMPSYMEGYVQALEKYMAYCIRVDKHKPTDFAIYQSF